MNAINALLTQKMLTKPQMLSAKSAIQCQSALSAYQTHCFVCEDKLNFNLAEKKPD